MFLTETEFGSSNHSFNGSLSLREVVFLMKFQATLRLKRGLEKSPQKAKHYKHEISYLDNLK